MLDELLVLGPSVKDSYHFQIVPVFLSIVGRDYVLPAQGTTYRFSVHKGHHKFDENRHPIQAHFTSYNGTPTMPVSACKLNFYVPNYLKLKRNDFILRMTQRECNQDFSIGEYYIDAGALIEEFKANKLKKHEFKTFFAMDYQLDFEIYMEQSRAALEQLVQDSSEERKAKVPNPFKIKDKAEKEEQKSIEQMNIISSQQSQSENDNEFKVEAIPKDADPVLVQSVKIKRLFRTFSKDADISPGIASEDGSKISKVPLIHTKFKQLAKIDTPHEIKMTESQRLSELTLSSLTVDEETQGFKRNVVLMWMYILTGIVVMYLAMHPVKKT